jgi:hypothetical protein
MDTMIMTMTMTMITTTTITTRIHTCIDRQAITNNGPQIAGRFVLKPGNQPARLANKGVLR